jgi:hypothetical protein
MKYSLAGAVALVAIGMLLLASSAHANPLYFPPTAQTSSATSSPAYMTSGAATSTLSYDAYQAGVTKAVDKGVVLIQTVASSTSSAYTFAVQYSQDNVDWYQDNTLATSTNPNIGNAQNFTFTAAGTATTSRAISISFPTRYVRVQASVLGAAGAVWMQIVPQRQAN